jgi:hypothetical protein
MFTRGWLGNLKSLAAKGTVVLCLQTSGTGIARACSCDPGSVPDAFASADAVFLGKLTREEADYEPLLPDPVPADYRPPDRWLNFEVLYTWKGVTGRDVGAITWAGGSFAGCGFFGTVGETYLIFAVVDPQKQRLRLPGCWKRSPEQLQEEVTELDTLAVRTRPDSGADPLFPPERSRASCFPCGIGAASGALFSALGLILFRFLPRYRFHNLRERDRSVRTRNQMHEPWKPSPCATVRTARNRRGRCAAAPARWNSSRSE